MPDLRSRGTVMTASAPKSGNKLYADFTDLLLLALFLFVLFLIPVFLLVFLAHFSNSLR